jgi:hypothetical protein
METNTFGNSLTATRKGKGDEQMVKIQRLMSQKNVAIPVPMTHFIYVWEADGDSDESPKKKSAKCQKVLNLNNLISISNKEKAMLVFSKSLKMIGSVYLK